MGQKKCICLIRVSTEQQKLEGQKEKVISTAINDGYSVEEIAVVEGKESAIKLNEEERETLNEMKDIIAQYPTIESVYVFAIDRLARKVSIVLSIKDYLLEHKINLVFLNPRKMSTMIKNEKGELVEDEITGMMLLFLSYGAQMEMKIKQARWAVTRDKMRSQNLVATGRPMFGYKKAKDKSVILDEEKAEIVRDIFVKYANEKWSMWDIYKEYFLRGVFKERPRATGVSIISRYIGQKAYYGDYSNDDKIGNIKYPPIVSKELWDKANEIAKKHAEGFKLHHKNVYYGKRLLRLMNNGLLMQPNISSVSYRGFDEAKAFININAVDSVIWMTTCKMQIIRLGMEQNRKQYNFKKEIAENEKQIKKLRELLGTIYEKEKKAFSAYLAGKVNEEIYDETMLSIQNEKTMWENDIARLESEITQFKMTSNEKAEMPKITQRKLAKLNDEERKKLIDEIIKEVQLTKNDDNTYEFKIIANDARLNATYNELFQNPRYHYFVRGGVMHLFEITDDITIDISDIVEKRIISTRKKKKKSSDLTFEDFFKS